MKNKLRYLFIIFLIIIVSIFIVNFTNKNIKKNNKRIIIDEKNSNNYVKKKKKEKNDEVGKDKTLSKIIEEIIDQECGNLEGDWQVAVDSLGGDFDISIYKSSNSKIESLPSASTIKIFLALETYRQVEGDILDEKNVENDIYLMLKDSNNESANRLIDLIGNYDMDISSQKINKTIKNITGENTTGLYRKMLHEGKENMASARDLNMALSDIYFGNFVNKVHSKKMMEAMAENNTPSKFKLLGNLPKEAKGYSKSGEIPDKGVENDIAIISIGDKVFAISFLSQYPNPVSHGQGPQFTCMQNLGQRISEAFMEYE